MPKKHYPKRGTMAFYPRKRASRIYPTLTSFSDSDKPKAMVFAGYKAGMTHTLVVDGNRGSATFGQEIQVPATILECPPLKVISVRAYGESTRGMFVLGEVVASEVPKNLGKKISIAKKKSEKKVDVDNISKVRFIVCTDPSQAAFGKKKPEIFEVEVGGKDVKESFEFAKGLLGKDIKLQDVLQEGEAIDTTAVTKGKGTQGPVKRFGVKIQNRHAKQKLRHVGAIGGEVPRKIRWTTRHAGQMGSQRRTELNKRIMKIGEGKDINPASGMHKYGLLKSNFVLLEGSVPGPKKRLVLMRSAIRPPKVKVQVLDVKYIAK